jgi:hypothetical protein
MTEEPLLISTSYTYLPALRLVVDVADKVIFIPLSADVNVAAFDELPTIVNDALAGDELYVFLTLPAPLYPVIVASPPVTLSKSIVAVKSDPWSIKIFE